MIVTAYSRIHFDIHLRQHMHIKLFVVLKATGGRKADKRDNCVSTYPALSGIQLRSGRVFCSQEQSVDGKFSVLLSENS